MELFDSENKRFTSHIVVCLLTINSITSFRFRSIRNIRINSFCKAIENNFISISKLGFKLLHDRKYSSWISYYTNLSWIVCLPCLEYLMDRSDCCLALIIILSLLYLSTVIGSESWYSLVIKLSWSEDVSAYHMERGFLTDWFIWRWEM